MLASLRQGRNRAGALLGVAAVLLCGVVSAPAEAAVVTRTWDGGCGVNRAWSCAANWSGDIVPGASDSVLLGASAVADSVVDQGFNSAQTVASLKLASGYTGTVSLASSLHVTGALTLAGPGRLDAGGQALDLDGALVLSAGTFRASSGTTTLAGNLTVTGQATYDANGGTLVLDGTRSATISCRGRDLGLVRLAHTKGTTTVAAGCSVPLGADPTTGAGAGLVVAGSLTGTGLLTVGTPTTTTPLTVRAAGALPGFAGLVGHGAVALDGATLDAGDWQRLDVDGGLAMTDGAAVTAPSATTRVGGDLALTTGAGLDPNGGTVELTGVTQALVGGPFTFAGLTKRATAPSTLTVAAGATVTVTDDLTLRGVPGAFVELRSSTPGTPWRLAAPGARTLERLKVGDSTNLDPVPLEAAMSFDRGGTTGWTFTPPDPAEVAGPVAPVRATQVASGSALLGRPLGIGSGGAGVVYLTDLDQMASPTYGKPGRVLRYQASTGAVTLVHQGTFGVYPTDVVAAPDGLLYFVDHLAGTIKALDPDTGTTIVVASGLSHPDYLAIDPSGQHLYVSDQNHYVVKRVALATGAVTTVAGTGSQAAVGAACLSGSKPATSVALNTPFGLAVGPDGSVYLGDQYRHVVYKLSGGQLTRVAGTCTRDSKNVGTGDGGPAAAAQVPYPQGLVVDPAGNLYVLQVQGQVRRVQSGTGTITTLYRGPVAGSNTDLALDPGDGSLYLTSQKVPALTRLTN